MTYINVINIIYLNPFFHICFRFSYFSLLLLLSTHHFLFRDVIACLGETKTFGTFMDRFEKA